MRPMHGVVALTSAIGLIPASSLAAITITINAQYDPRGIFPDNQTNNASTGDWRYSWADRAYFDNPMPYVQVCVWEKDGACIDHANHWLTDTCAETDDVQVSCGTADVNGVVTMIVTPGDDDGTYWEFYTRTDYRGGAPPNGQEARVARNIASSEYAQAVSPTHWSVSESATSTSRYWNVTCPDHFGSTSASIDCDLDIAGGETDPDRYFNAARGYTGWYALHLRDVTALLRTGFTDYNPTYIDCDAYAFQSIAKVVVMSDDGDGTDKICAVADEGDILCLDYLHSATFNTDCNDNCFPYPCDSCELEAAPEAYPPAQTGHPLGHLLHRRWMCLCDGDLDCGSAPIDGSLCDCPVTHAWSTITTERCATCEGWAEFVQTASLWPQDYGSRAGETGGTLAAQSATGRQTDLITPSGANGSGAAQRDCQCDDEAEECDSSCADYGGVGGPPDCNDPNKPQMCDAAGAQFFWDAYDTFSEADPVPGCTPATEGCDNSDATFSQMIGVWGTMANGSSCGSSENYDREDESCSPQNNTQGSTSEMASGRNIWDFDDVSGDNLSHEAYLNCVGGSDQS